jgi:hypothetical protein
MLFRDVKQTAELIREKTNSIYPKLNAYNYPTLPLQKPKSLVSYQLESLTSVQSTQPNTRRMMSRREMTSLRIASNIRKFNSPHQDRSQFNTSLLITTVKPNEP